MLTTEARRATLSPAFVLHLIRMSTAALDLLSKQNALLLSRPGQHVPARRVAELAGQYDGLRWAFEKLMRELPATIRPSHC